ncbi:pectinesterase inhibitor 10 [Triticum aestivum]|uniref:pectinesterase inhibitor 10 n=1 Tax=Triticum aestivum TaxID=4565 RepID=UPI001D020956|nr:pectinesterase inhibitor 10-like [Triticum aestivum]
MSSGALMEFSEYKVETHARETDLSVVYNIDPAVSSSAAAGPASPSRTSPPLARPSPPPIPTPASALLPPEAPAPPLPSRSCSASPPSRSRAAPLCTSCGRRLPLPPEAPAGRPPLHLEATAAGCAATNTKTAIKIISYGHNSWVKTSANLMLLLTITFLLLPSDTSAAGWNGCKSFVIGPIEEACTRKECTFACQDGFTKLGHCKDGVVKCGWKSNCVLLDVTALYAEISTVHPYNLGTNNKYLGNNSMFTT